jgi:serine/threonine-protein kinase mTOR
MKSIMVNDVSLVCAQSETESVSEISPKHGHFQVRAAYLKYQWSLGDDITRREAFSRLQVSD